MSAAAAGASCRNARKRQALELKANKEKAAAKALKEKLEAEKAAELSTPTKSKQFHQLPASYLKPPHARGRKLSVGYTGNSSKLLLPINEQSAHRHSPSQQTLHHQSRHHLHHTNERGTPSYGCHFHGDTRLDVQHKKLSKSATASFPLVDQAGAPPGTPGICFRQQHFFKQSQTNLLSAHHHHHQINIQIPVNEGIIITPATPLPSPSPSTNVIKQQEALTAQQTAQDEGVAAKIDDMPEFPLERACSVYRNRKLEGNETTFNIADPDEENQQQLYPGGMPNGNGGHHTHWADEYCCECESRMFEPCDHIEVKNFIVISFLCFSISRSRSFCLFCKNNFCFE